MSTVVIPRPVRPGTAFSRANAVVRPQRVESAPLPSAQLRVIKPARQLPQPVRNQRDLNPSVAPAARTSRRGRLLSMLKGLSFMTLGALIVLVGASFVAPQDAQAGSSPVDSSSVGRTVTVDAGQTLWDVAREVSPESDPRDVVNLIIDVNNLSSTTLHTGQNLEIPVMNG
ncbi:LysM peptidoglycan-binding domain-containing protein [Rothia terrae]|uniref:LysM peptidoglycan-binding domain-containing protein n=1 Tax=Rothia terrae TaxID=396015 RepID=UPI002880C186|nr:LysM peptidoglycan-binding domain-containing protein [Rothia terrae]MDT0190029.1 LysM peptidoglycan-binding domain-containing protein [Rothia terrae]